MAASATARRVAAQRLTFARLEAPYGDPGADDRLAREVAGDLPGEGPLHRYLEARTRFFDAAVVGAISSGMTQIVVGAAGYDGRAWRYAKPGVRWFEVDHPATQADKRDRVRALELATDHVRFVPTDFAIDPLGPALRSAGFDLSSPTLFMLEGVAVYLTRPVLDSLLTQLAALAAPSSRLAISLSVSGHSPGADERRQVFRAAVAALGEPVRSSVAPTEVDDLLAAAGWRARPSGVHESERARLAGLVMAVPG